MELKLIFDGVGLLVLLAVFTMLLVIVAMVVDGVSGWRKAKLRNEARTSYAFSRSFSKFLIYQGILLITTCIDMLVHVGMILFVDWNYCVPVVTIFGGIIFCVVEIWSVYEKADAKAKKRIKQVTVTGVQAAIDKDALAQAITAGIAEALRTSRDDMPTKRKKKGGEHGTEA